jgi:hypothetical protein
MLQYEYKNTAYYDSQVHFLRRSINNLNSFSFNRNIQPMQAMETMHLAARNNLCNKVKLKIDGEEWHVSESEGLARSSDNRVVVGSIEFQSQMTAPLAQAIFSGSPCGLPTLAESAQQHTLFVGNLLEHWNQNMPNKLDRLPIT